MAVRAADSQSPLNPQRNALPPAMIALAPADAGPAACGGDATGDAAAVVVTEALVQRVLSSLEQLARRNTKRYLAAPARSARKSAALPPEAAAFVARFNPAADAEPVTAFHSASVPEAPLATVAATLQRGLHRHLDHTTCLMAVVLVRRFEAATKLPVTLHMMHRLYLAALLVALKCHADRPVEPTRTFAVLCSMPAAELSRMEALLLQGIEYRALVAPHELRDAVDAFASPTPQRASTGTRPPSPVVHTQRPVSPTSGAHEAACQGASGPYADLVAPMRNTATSPESGSSASLGRSCRDDGNAPYICSSPAPSSSLTATTSSQS